MSALKSEVHVAEVMRAYNAAISRKDANAVTAFYTADVVGYGLGPAMFLEAKDVRDPDYVQAWFEMWTGPIEVGVRTQVIHVDGNLAHVYCIRSLTGTKKLSGEHFSLWFRSSVLLVRRNETWKIVHIHNSVPTEFS